MRRSARREALDPRHECKGGAGNSLVARLLAEMKREAEPVTWLVDGDGEVGQLVQYLGRRDPGGRLVREQRGDEGVATFALHGWRDDAGMRDVLDGLIRPLQDAVCWVLSCGAEHLVLPGSIQRLGLSNSERGALPLGELVE